MSGGSRLKPAFRPGRVGLRSAFHQGGVCRPRKYESPAACQEQAARGYEKLLHAQATLNETGPGHRARPTGSSLEGHRASAKPMLPLGAVRFPVACCSAAGGVRRPKFPPSSAPCRSMCARTMTNGVRRLCGLASKAGGELVSFAAWKSSSSMGPQRLESSR